MKIHLKKRKSLSFVELLYEYKIKEYTYKIFIIDKLTQTRILINIRYNGEIIPTCILMDVYKHENDINNLLRISKKLIRSHINNEVSY